MKAAPVIARQVIHALNQAGLTHVLVGSFARNYYAEPRSTKDADVVVSMSGTSLKPFLDALGPDFRLDEQMAFETNAGTLKNVLSHAESSFTVELFYLGTDPHDQGRFRRRRTISYGSLPTCVLTAEDFIITQLRRSRSKAGRRARCHRHAGRTSRLDLHSSSDRNSRHSRQAGPGASEHSTTSLTIFITASLSPNPCPTPNIPSNCCASTLVAPSMTASPRSSAACSTTRSR